MMDITRRQHAKETPEAAGEERHGGSLGRRSPCGGSVGHPKMGRSSWRWMGTWALGSLVVSGCPSARAAGQLWAGATGGARPLPPTGQGILARRSGPHGTLVPDMEPIGPRGLGREALDPHLRRYLLAQDPLEQSAVEGENEVQDPAALVREEVLFAGLPKVSNSLWVAKHQGQLFFRDIDDNGRAIHMRRVLELTHDRYPYLPDFGPVFVCGWDYFQQCEQWSPTGRIPGRIALTAAFDVREIYTPKFPRILAVPDHAFDSWPSARLGNFDEAGAEIRAVGRQAPATNLAGWVGNTFTSSHRKDLIQIAAEHPEDIEAIAMTWAPGNSGGYLSLKETVARYAYLIDIEGFGYSGRVKYLLHSNRPLLMQERSYHEFFFHHLVPFEHFVPVRSDLSNLVERVLWLREHPEEGRRIAGAAQRLALTYLTQAGAAERFAHVLIEVGAESNL